MHDNLPVPVIMTHRVTFLPVMSQIRCQLCTPYVIGQAIIFLPCGFFFFFYLLFSTPNLRSESCCTRLAGNAGRKKSKKIAFWAPSHNFVGYIFATKARIDNRKSLLNSNTSPTCPHNTVNFDPLAAEIGSLVWGTPANFNGFRVLAALLHGILVVGVRQRYLYSAGGHHVGHWPTF